MSTRQVPIEPGGPMVEEPSSGLIRKSFDDWITEFFNARNLPGFAQFGTELTTFRPVIDVKENGKEVLVTAEIPGATEEDVEVLINGEYLTIKGTKNEETEEKGDHWFRRERSYGSFQRVLPLPSDVEQKKISASMKDGILTVSLPKSAEALKQSRQIPVKKAKD